MMRFISLTGRDGSRQFVNAAAYYASWFPNQERFDLLRSDQTLRDHVSLQLFEQKLAPYGFSPVIDEKSYNLIESALAGHHDCFATAFSRFLEVVFGLPNDDPRMTRFKSIFNYNRTQIRTITRRIPSGKRDDFLNSLWNKTGILIPSPDLLWESGARLYFEVMPDPSQSYRKSIEFLCENVELVFQTIFPSLASGTSLDPLSMKGLDSASTSMLAIGSRGHIHQATIPDMTAVDQLTPLTPTGYLPNFVNPQQPIGGKIYGETTPDMPALTEIEIASVPVAERQKTPSGVFDWDNDPTTHRER